MKAPFVSLGGWKIASFLVGPESDVRQWGPWPAGPVRPSDPCSFGVAKAPFVSLGGWKTAKTANFLVGSESNVRHWGPWPAGWKTAKTASFLVGSESDVRHPVLVELV